MKCPLLNKSCIEKKCAWYADFWVRDKAGDEPKVESACVVPRIPFMMIELIKNTNGTQAASEAVRNRMEHVVHNGQVQNEIFAELAQRSERKALGDST